MKPEEFKAKLNEAMQNLSDQAKVTEIFTELTTDYDTVHVETTTAKETATKLTADNESLRKVNMDMFLKVGANVKEAEQQKEEDTTPKFEDLFNEKGELK
jgi:hypothetical protein